MSVSPVSSSNLGNGFSSRLKTIDVRPIAGNTSGSSTSDSASQSSGSGTTEEENSSSESSPDQSIPGFGSANRFALISRNRGGTGGEETGLPSLLDNATSRNSSSGNSVRGPNNLTPAEQRQVQRLKRIDAKVRAHEQAHLAAAGQFAQGGATFEFVTGPDGNQYAVGGSVSLDTSKASTPEKTVDKMRQVRQAALAPANPSPQDFQVAATASQRLAEAQQQVNQQESEENSSANNEDNGSGSSSASNESQPGSSESSSSTSGRSTVIERAEDFGVEVNDRTRSLIQEQSNPTRIEDPFSSSNNPSDSSPTNEIRENFLQDPEVSNAGKPGQLLNLLA